MLGGMPLSRLRMDLDFMPSPVPDRPGLLIRDPHQFSDVTLIIPPPLVEALRFFDGEASELDLRQALVQIAGTIEVGDLLDSLTGSLSRAGFLEDDKFIEIRDTCIRAFAEAPVREAAHAGSAYPDEPAELKEVFDEYLDKAERAAAADGLIGIAAPHVSPFGGWESYRDAYTALSPDLKDRVFVVLGTSHYGEPEKFGLTRKDFATPYGVARTEKGLVDRLEADAPGAVRMEDFCHATEHSIEFQVAFLQHLFGPEIRILPILCGPYAHSIYEGGDPEDDSNVQRFLGAVGELYQREKERLFWVLGVDLAHMGRRYGDGFAAVAERDEMSRVAERDRSRLEAIGAGDARGFWEQVKEGRDDLKWCGSAPFYSFLRAVPEARGELRRYQQWNIDEQSVVSFGAVAFRAGH
jgi:MEMO1 family protein